MDTGRPSRGTWRLSPRIGRGVVAGAMAVFAAFAPASSARNLAPELALASGQQADASSVALSALPHEAQTTHRLILAGGPFSYQKDGVVFGNRERLLPRHPRGYYREYTVRTPGVRNRGARRIVCGGEPPNRPEVCYYTDDHYANFRRIVGSQPSTNR